MRRAIAPAAGNSRTYLNWRSFFDPARASGPDFYCPAAKIPSRPRFNRFGFGRAPERLLHLPDDV
jgi:hypothetical protein